MYVLHNSNYEKLNLLSKSEVLIPERAMLRMVSRSISAAALASNRIEGRVKGRRLPGSGSVEALRTVLIACS